MTNAVKNISARLKIVRNPSYITRSIAPTIVQSFTIKNASGRMVIGTQSPDVIFDIVENVQIQRLAENILIFQIGYTT